jgi:hypothetical protein
MRKKEGGKELELKLIAIAAAEKALDKLEKPFFDRGHDTSP